jgi:pteridine reductase
MNIHGRVAIVTGGAHRLGRAITLALAQAGANVVIHYHGSEAQAQATMADVQAAGVETISIQADLMQIAEAEHVVDATLDRWGRLDILVCNAGIWGSTPLGNVTPERWDELYALNTRAPFFLAQRAAPYLRASMGCVVAITDVGIYSTWKNYTPYLSSKAALAMVVQNLAKDLSPDVRVNAVAPGAVLLPEDWNEEQHAKAANNTLLKRVGTPEDVAEAVLFLARADYVTGVMLPVDGGWHLH